MPADWRQRPMRLVYDAVSRVAESSVNVLVRGESGTGKELVAQAIVASGSAEDKPFVSVNCAALPESLIEAELFGHGKGAFTDAHEARAGHIEAAHGGTLFLDEIGTLGLSLQSKLLRVLEQHVVQRIGSRTSKKIDFRLIAATNEDLEQAVRAGRFREDLYYRINVVPIVLPPLRERTGDVAILLDHFLRMYCAANSLPLKRLDADALEILEEYHWPGNVRELENLVQRLVIMGSGAVITAKHLPQQILVPQHGEAGGAAHPGEGHLVRRGDGPDRAGLPAGCLAPDRRQEGGGRRPASDQRAEDEVPVSEIWAAGLIIDLTRVNF